MPTASSGPWPRPGWTTRWTAPSGPFLAPDLLILDDLGLHRLTAQQSADLYKLILNRHRASSSSSPATGPWMNGSALVHGAPSPDRVAVVTETPVFVTLPQTLGLGRVHAVPKPSHFWAGAKPMIYGYIRTSRAAVDGLAGMHPETQVQAGVEPRHSLDVEVSASVWPRPSGTRPRHCPDGEPFADVASPRPSPAPNNERPVVGKSTGCSTFQAAGYSRDVKGEIGVMDGTFQLAIHQVVLDSPTIKDIPAKQ